MAVEKQNTPLEKLYDLQRTLSLQVNRYVNDDNHNGRELRQKYDEWCALAKQVLTREQVVTFKNGLLGDILDQCNSLHNVSGHQKIYAGDLYALLGKKLQAEVSAHYAKVDRDQRMAQITHFLRHPLAYFRRG